jgi:hypothetical protein
MNVAVAVASPNAATIAKIANALFIIVLEDSLRY